MGTNHAGSEDNEKGRLKVTGHLSLTLGKKVGPDLQDPRGDPRPYFKEHISR
jgi:hypothetical protein